MMKKISTSEISPYSKENTVPQNCKDFLVGLILSKVMVVVYIEIHKKATNTNLMIVKVACR
jgi:hypothetical protein